MSILPPRSFEYWAFTGIGKLYKSAPSLTNPNALLPGYARIHYFRPDGNYTNWTCYAFDDTAEFTGDFNDGLTGVTSFDSYGAYFDISLIPNAQKLGFIIHNTSTGAKDPGPDMILNVGTNTEGMGYLGECGRVYNDANAHADTGQPAEYRAGLLDRPAARRYPTAIRDERRDLCPQFRPHGQLVGYDQRASQEAPRFHSPPAEA